MTTRRLVGRLGREPVFYGERWRSKICNDRRPRPPPPFLAYTCAISSLLSTTILRPGISSVGSSPSNSIAASSSPFQPSVSASQSLPGVADVASQWGRGKGRWRDSRGNQHQYSAAGGGGRKSFIRRFSRSRAYDSNSNAEGGDNTEENSDLRHENAGGSDQQQQKQLHPLLVVATPLGNVQDLSPRAQMALETADVIYCEDTRVSQNLLQHLNAAPSGQKRFKLRSLHSHNEEHRTQEVIEAVESGLQVAVISDAGTPGISDPGARLVEAFHHRKLPVSPIPGPSAVSTLLSVAGMPSKHIFLGFLPKTRGSRITRMKQSLKPGFTLVVFTPMRDAVDVLTDLSSIAPTAQVTLGRELTKSFEEVRRDAVSSLIESLQTRPPEQLRGEATLCIALPPSGATKSNAGYEGAGADRSGAGEDVKEASIESRNNDDDDEEALVLDLDVTEKATHAATRMLKGGLSRRDATDVLAALKIAPKRELIKIVLHASEALAHDGEGDDQSSDSRRKGGKKKRKGNK